MPFYTSIALHTLPSSPPTPSHNLPSSPSTPPHNLPSSPSTPSHNLPSSPSTPPHNPPSSPFTPPHTLPSFPSPIHNLKPSSHSPSALDKLTSISSSPSPTPSTFDISTSTHTSTPSLSSSPSSTHSSFTPDKSDSPTPPSCPCPAPPPASLSPAIPVLPEASPRLQHLLGGAVVEGDCGNDPSNPPPWLDRELFERGRQFYKRFLFCLSFSDLVSLVLMLTMQPSLRVLIYTSRSDTLAKARRRYLSTMLHLMAWYQGDVWQHDDEARADILAVRATHASVARKVNSRGYSKILSVNVADKGHKVIKDPYFPHIAKDFGEAVAAVGGVPLPLPDPTLPRPFLSQLDMSLTQYTFFGLILVHPHKLGAGSASREDFQGLIHFWRGIGWLLGVADEYNFCNGSVEEVRALSLEVEQRLGLAGLAAADWNYEHMASCIMNGMFTFLPLVSYPATLLFLAHLLDVPVPSLRKATPIPHRLRFWAMRVVFAILNIFPHLLINLNRQLVTLTKRVKSFLNGHKQHKHKTSTTQSSSCPFS